MCLISNDKIPRILLIESSHANSLLFKEYLALSGRKADVSTSYSLRDAQKLLSEFTPDLIFICSSLVQREKETFKTMSSEVNLKHIPLIILTEIHGEEKYILDGTAANAYPLHRPFDLASVDKVITQILDICLESRMAKFQV